MPCYRCIGGRFAGLVIEVRAPEPPLTWRIPLPQMPKASWHCAAHLSFKTVAATVAHYDLHTTADGINIALYRGES